MSILPSTRSPYLYPEGHKNKFERALLGIPSNTPYVRKETRIAWLIDNAHTDAPYIRTRLPDPYGYLQRTCDIFPPHSPNHSLEVSDRMTDAYRTQALLWVAFGRKERPWVHRCRPTFPFSGDDVIFRSNLCLEIFQPKPYEAIIRKVEEAFAKVFTPEVLASTYNLLPEDRSVARFIPSDDEMDVFGTPVKTRWWCYISTQMR